MKDEVESLRTKARSALSGARGSAPPFPGLLGPLLDWFEHRHIDRMRQAGFTDARIAFKWVFLHLPPDGARVTDLAAKAGMTKQAMAEIVDEMVAKGYLARLPDPTDGRAKLILWAERGLAAHRKTMQLFGDIERDLEVALGGRRTAELRWLLLAAGGAIRESGAPGPATETEASQSKNGV